MKGKPVEKEAVKERSAIKETVEEKPVQKEAMEPILRQGLTDLGLSTASVPAMLRYAQILLNRNRQYNLTAVTDPAEVARLHFLDCAAVLPLYPFRDRTVLDVGSGAGFPGLPLRLVEPSIRLTLLDAQGKRVDFLREICAALELEEVQCIQDRAETFAAAHRETFDIVISRAVAALPILTELCLPLVRPGGCFLAMKSVNAAEETDSARNAIATLGGELDRVEDYMIPGTDVRRRLIVIRKIQPAPPAYPRPFAKIKRRPL